MQPEDLNKGINKTLKSTQENITKSNVKRLNLLSALITGAIISRKSDLYAISMNLSQDLQAESKIVKTKRFLSSKWTTQELQYQPYLKNVLTYLWQKPELILVIDGSDTGKNCATLMCSVRYKNRALPLAWITRKGKKGHFSVATHLELLQKVKAMLPNTHKSPRIVFLGDGEFDSLALINELEKLGWDYVLRTSLDRQILDKTGEKFKIRDLGNWKGEHYSIAHQVFAQNSANAILWHLPQYPAPIPLLTNIELAKEACFYYSKRFSIETFFKDIKSNGFSIHKSHIFDPTRIANLLIIICLAYLFLFCLGATARKNDKVVFFARKDTLHKISDFNLGIKVLISFLAVFFNNCLFAFFSYNFTFFICVRC